MLKIVMMERIGEIFQTALVLGAWLCESILVLIVIYFAFVYVVKIIRR